jgi:hypothetical protein
VIAAAGKHRRHLSCPHTAEYTRNDKVMAVGSLIAIGYRALKFRWKMLQKFTVKAK